LEIELKLSQSAIGPAVKNPILTGVILSDRFCARYSPPQPGIIHFQSDADGQLSLLNFEIESASEPPDPDDFESLDAFPEALARWDVEHPEELAVSLDYFCEWDPCPDTWYELAQVVEVAPGAIESSITSNFFIPVFGAAGVSPNRRDQPIDTGIYARLPKPKPPCFPLMAVSQARLKRIPNAYQTHTKLNPNAYQTQFPTFLFSRLARRTIARTEARSRLTQEFSRAYPNQSPPTFPRRSPASRTHPERIPNASRKYPESISTTTQLVCSGANQQPARSPPGGDAYQ
jgi:hypothetical protein